MDAEERSTFAWELHSEADTHTHTDALTRAPMQIGTHTHIFTHTHTTTQITPVGTESARC